LIFYHFLLLYFGLGKPIRTSIYFSVPHERQQLQLARSNTISPFVGSIKIAPTPKTTIKERTSPNHHQQIKFDVKVVCPLPPPQSFSLDHKRKRGVKKVLRTRTTIQEEPEDDLAFSKDEDEKQCTGTYSKGQFDKSQQND
jgi:hypothetical protein